MSTIIRIQHNPGNPAEGANRKEVNQKVEDLKLALEGAENRELTREFNTQLDILKNQNEIEGLEKEILTYSDAYSIYERDEVDEDENSE